jgi:hypothetical protein
MASGQIMRRDSEEYLTGQLQSASVGRVANLPAVAVASKEIMELVTVRNPKARRPDFILGDRISSRPLKILRGA